VAQRASQDSAQHHQVALGKIDEPGRADHQTEAEPQEGVERAVRNSGKRGLRDVGEIH
jgi:hypothetical protein